MLAIAAGRRNTARSNTSAGSARLAYRKIEISAPGRHFTFRIRSRPTTPISNPDHRPGHLHQHRVAVDNRLAVLAERRRRPAFLFRPMSGCRSRSAGLYLASSLCRCAGKWALFSRHLRSRPRLALGLEKKVSRGPMSLKAGILGFIQFEGFLASIDGSMTAKKSNGFDYMWFAGQLGVQGYLKGEIDLKIISASVSIKLTLVLQIAYETDQDRHRAQLQGQHLGLVPIVSLRLVASTRPQLVELSSQRPGRPITATPIPRRAPAPAAQLAEASRRPPYRARGRRPRDLRSKPRPGGVRLFRLHPTVVNRRPARRAAGGPGCLPVAPSARHHRHFTAFARSLLAAERLCCTAASRPSRLDEGQDRDGTFETVSTPAVSPSASHLPQASLSAQGTRFFNPMCLIGADLYGATIAFNGPTLPPVMLNRSPPIQPAGAADARCP